MQRKICTFAGHREIYDADSIKVKLKNEIINLIENHGVTSFYNGGKGKFDFGYVPNALKSLNWTTHL